MLGDPGAHLLLQASQGGGPPASVRLGRKALRCAPAAQQFLDKTEADLEGVGGLGEAPVLLFDGVEDTATEIFRVRLGHGGHNLRTVQTSLPHRTPE